MKVIDLYPDRPLAAVQTVEPRDLSSDCVACSLHQRANTVCMSARFKQSDNKGRGLVMVIGEHPSTNSDRLGRPFESTSERWFRRMLGRLWDGDVLYDYALRCSPKGATLNASHHSHCRPHLAAVLSEVRPDRIVTLGNHAAKGLLGYSRGGSVHCNRRGYAYMYPDQGPPIPVFLLSKPSDPSQNRFLRERFEADLTWALEALPEEPPLDAVAFDLHPTQADADWLLDFVKDSPGVTVDVETYGEHFTDEFRVLSMGIALDHGEDVAVLYEDALARDTPTYAALRHILTSDQWEKRGQNFKYDYQSIRDGMGIEVSPVFGDSRLIFKGLNPDGDAALDQLGELVGMGGHKEEADAIVRAEVKRLRSEFRRSGAEFAIRHFRAKAYAYAALPREVNLRYVGRDALTTSKVIQKFAPPLRDAYDGALWDTYRRTIDPASATLANIESNGVAIDETAVKALGAELRMKISDIDDELAALGSIKPASHQSVSDFLYHQLRLPVTEHTKSGKPSTAKATLERMRSVHPAIPLILEWRRLVKLETTYVNGLLPFIREDGRIHPTLLLDGTGTGRLSCIAGWQPVGTRRGLIPMSDVRPGDEVWTHRGRWCRVTAAWCNGVRPVVDLHLTTGEKITCTADHRFLTIGGEWLTVQEMIDGGFQEVDAEPEDAGGGGESVPGHGLATDNRDHRADTGDDASERPMGGGELHPRGRAGHVEAAPVLAIEAGGQEPDDGEDREGASQLQGGVRRRVWLPDLSAQREARLRSSAGGGAVAGVGAWGSTVVNRGASHRRGSEKQRDAQSGPLHQHGPPGDPRPGNGNDPRVVRIERITAEVGPGVREVAVYDLTVEGDASFAVGGVFAHNCKDPNLQNQPSRGGKEAKLVKDCFVAGPGRALLQVDFGTLEIRVAAYLSGDPKMIQVLQSGIDFHLGTAKLIGPVVWDMSPEEIEAEFRAGNKTKRSIAKTINFGTLYGQSAFALAAQISAILGVEFSVDKAEEAQGAILGEFIVLREWIEDQRRRVAKTGDAWTFWDGNKARRRPLYGAGYQDSKRAGTAIRSSFNTPIQGTGSDYCLMSLIELERICRDFWGRRCFPVLTVHDSVLFDLELDLELICEVIEVSHEVMTGWPSGDVPLVVDYELGLSWGSLEGLNVDDHGVLRNFSPVDRLIGGL